ncbi:MAG TPA: alpha/beta fold hydrolase [Nitrososphaeraceae archaeon]|nr:alpha/beta fold hydrolase [Nitrososphaeraceae archaeon]
MMSDLKFTKVNNLRVRYLDSNKKSTPLLLLHGLGGSIESWTNNIEFLSTKFRIIALDLPGFGLSDKPKISYSINFYVGFLEKFIKRIKLNHLFVIGSSLGGHIAVEFTIRNGKNVDKLILISPAGSLPKTFKGTKELRKYLGIVNAKSSNDVSRILSSIDNSMVSRSYADAVYKRLSLPGAKQAFISAMKGSATAPRYNSKLSKIDTDMLLIWGREDRMIPLRFIRPFIEYGKSRIVILEKCGHRPHVEKPKLFNRIVKDFLVE